MARDERIYQAQADICKALANPKRIQILDILKDGEMTAGDLARRLEISTPNLSQHVNLLREKGLIEARRDGLNVYYSLANPRITEACTIVRQVLLETLLRHQSLLAE